MSQVPFLSYYAKNNIIPTRQRTEHLDALFARRKALYRQVGLVEPLVRGHRVVEFGPGTGDNALFTDSLGPSSLVLVDGNPASIEALREKEAHGLFRPGVRILHENILSFVSQELFNIVLCEGGIPGQRDPGGFLLKVARHVELGGSLMFTVVSPLSYLAEVCRRLLLPFVREAHGRDDELLAALVALYAPGLESLKGMSRRHDDWVQDNILHPWTGGLSPADQALRTLDGHFSPVGGSPSYLQDWRWFMGIPEDGRSANQMWEESYRMWRAYLIDYRVMPSSGGEIPRGEGLDEMAGEMSSNFTTSSWAAAMRERWPRLKECCCKSAPKLPPPCRRPCGQFESFMAALDQFKRGNLKADLREFHAWFGRGQQYMHFVREQ